MVVIHPVVVLTSGLLCTLHLGKHSLDRIINPSTFTDNVHVPLSVFFVSSVFVGFLVSTKIRVASHGPRGRDRAVAYLLSPTQGAQDQSCDGTEDWRQAAEERKRTRSVCHLNMILTNRETRPSAKRCVENITKKEEKLSPFLNIQIGSSHLVINSLRGPIRPTRETVS